LISISDVPSAPCSWCQIEVVVEQPDQLTVVRETLPSPPLTVIALNMKTVPNPKTHENEIVAVSFLVHHAIHMDKPAPKVPYQEHFCGKRRGH
jgi:DNA polymerase alpha subunit A